MNINGIFYLFIYLFIFYLFFIFIFFFFFGGAGGGGGGRRGAGERWGGEGEFFVRNKEVKTCNLTAQQNEDHVI